MGFTLKGILKAELIFLMIVEDNLKNKVSIWQKNTIEYAKKSPLNIPGFILLFEEAKKIHKHCSLVMECYEDIRKEREQMELVPTLGDILRMALK